MKSTSYYLFIVFMIIFIFTNQFVYATSSIVCQGMLHDSNHNPINRVIKIRFEIINTSNLILWQNERFVTFNNGFFYVTLGKLTPIPNHIINKENQVIISFLNATKQFIQIAKTNLTKEIITFDEIIQLPCDCDNLLNKNNENNEYADIVIEAWYSNANSNFDTFYGGNGSSYPVKVEPEVVLGNNNKFISLPTGSFIIVGFTDNSIFNAPNQDDIFIKEVGASGEKAEVYVSSDSKEFVLLGIAQDNKTTSLDLEDIKFDKPVAAIKIVGLDNKGGSPGFDVVSVKAITGSSGYSLRIISNGPGIGIIKSVPAGISCGMECFQSFPGGTEVKLVATPDSKSTFGGWSINQYKGKIDIDNNECTVLLNSNTVIFATFYLNCNNTNSINSITSKGSYYNELNDKP
jgi:hypothetical protein